MSEYEIKRTADGRFLPGFSANPTGIQNNYQHELVKAIRDKYPPGKIVAMMETCWEMATVGPLASPKAAISFMTDLLNRTYGKPQTTHIRVNTKFEDMLAALGSNEPVTIDGEATEE